tara:strand:- start:3309 stop:5753 length:2445 start_codon:yes stop_codon:yes gene_type:complete
MNHLRLALVFAFTLNISHSQTTIGNFEDIIFEKENSIDLKATNGMVKIEFCSPSIVRFRTSWDGFFEPNEPWMVTKYAWQNVNYIKAEDNEALDFITDKLRIHIQKTPLLISIYNTNGKLLSSEKIAATEISGAIKEIEKVSVVKKLMPEEHFFGFGERMDFLDQRGKNISLNVGRGQGRPHIIGAYNVLEANYSPIPFFMSTAGYGIFFHNAYPTNWDMGYSSSNKYTFSAEGGELDYYFIYGPDFSAILDNYTDITGKSPLLPKFALGLQVGTYSGGTWGHEEETSANYVVNLVKKFRELQIPLDILHLDSTWRIFGENGGKGATSFEWRETFVNPEVMFDSLYAMHLNMVGLHLRPRFDNGKKLRLLDAAQKKGFVYPEENGKGEFVNFFDQKSVDWWWENGVMRVAKQGAMFLKTDEGSAFGHKANEIEKVGPQGEEIKALHNLFPLAYAKAPYEKFQAYNQIRGMNQTREGYAGIQRYPYIFAGDWPSEWQYFEPVIKAGLNIGLSGVGNWAHCMGGFEHVADPELYIRWCQFGLLSPIAHLFGMEHPNYKEPWNYGEEALRIFKQYDELRYSLIPYLYSASYEMHTTGKPLMRALVLEYQEDENVYDITDQYLLGNSLMICPVTTKGAQTRVVYLPEGKWINYWTGEYYTGKQHINVVCPIDQMPIFIKSGAILPTQEVLNYIGEKEIGTINLEIYPEKESDFTLYDDDGKSLNYQEGDFSETLTEVNDTDSTTEITIHEPKGNYKILNRTYSLKIHLDKMPKLIEMNTIQYPMVDSKNQKLDAFYEKGILFFNVDLKNETVHIKIQH